MAFTVTARHTGTSGATAAASQATNSTTPTANSLLLAFGCLERDQHAVAETLPWAFTGGGTWVPVADAPSSQWTGTPDFNVTAALQRLAVGGSPSAHTITVDAWAGAEDAYYSVVACDITGHNVSSPIAQFKVGGATEGGGDSESLAVTFDNALTTGNLVIASFAAGNDIAAAFTAPTIGGQTMTQLHNLTGTFCHAGMWYRILTGAESNGTVTCSDLGQSVGASAAILVEVALASSGTDHTQTPTDNLGLTDSTTIEKVRAQSATDDLGLTDSSALALGRAQTPTDTEGLTDTRIFDQSKVRTDNLGLTDSVTLSGVYKYVTDISANGRYFVDQDGNPILIRGESPWSMFTDLSSSEMDTYLQNRASYGCNLALVSMIGSVANGGPADTGATYDSVLPFTGGDITVFNSTYWSRMDSYIAKARDLGITLMIYPMDGWNCTFGGTVFDPGDVTNTDCQTYGQTLATRYLSYPNIIWSFGGDYPEDATINARFNACLTGIRAAGDTRPASIQLLYETSESHNSSFWETKVDWDWVYTYYVTYKGTSDAYNYTWSLSPTTRPALFSEGAYENSGSPHFGTDEALRRQACWALTSGSPGELTGQEDVWDFQSGWASLLDTTAADQIKIIRDTFEALDWWTLVPDDANQLVTAGRGTRVTTDSATFPASNNYVTAAKSADGTLAVIYLPNAASAITADMTKIGANPVATWVDPTTGTTFSETPDGSYSRADNAASDSDWLLILTGDAGTSHTQTPTDNLGLTDTATIQLVRAVSASDTEGLTDTAALTRSQAVSEALGLTDSVQIDKGILSTLQDNLGLTDTLARSVGSGLLDVEALTDVTVADLGKAVADSLGLTDTASLVAVRAISATDTLGLTDSTSVQLTSAGAVNPTDQISLSDTQRFDLAAVSTDNLTMTDTVISALSIPRSHTDSIGLTDSVTVTTNATNEWVQTPSDALVLTDSIVFSRVTVRPNTGRTARPNTGTTARP